MLLDKKIVVMHFVCGLSSGGAEQVIYNYCKHMNRKKYKFIIIYQHKPDYECIKKMQDAGFETIRITARCDGFVRNIIDSYAIIKKYKPDIIHSHMNLMNFCALFPGLLAGVKVRICHSHIAEVNKNFLYQVMAFICKKLNICSANSYMACGREAGEYLYGTHMMKKKNKIYILVNAIDVDEFIRNYAVREIVREKLGINENLVIGHVGRFSEQKNHTRLIDIFNEVKKINQDARLLLVGAGEKEKEIRNKVSELKLEKEVIFYGTSKNISDIYNAMDVFVLPSLFEGFPVVSLEVQAADLPAVFSDTIADTSRITEAIHFISLKETDKAWAEKIIEVYNTRKSNDISGLRYKYDVKVKVKELERLYENLLKKYTGGEPE